MRVLKMIIAILAGILITAVVARGQDVRNVNPEKVVKACGDVGTGLDFFSLDKEISLGKTLAQEVERTSKLLDDPVVTEYVNRVGQNIVRNSDAKVPFTIKVIDSSEVNAFALPGGFFFVNVGLVMEAEDEAELAGVMAHETGHVADRHGTRQATRGDLAQIASIPLIFVGGGIGAAARGATSFAVPMSFLKFSRAFEEKADCLGLLYMYNAGYDPNALISMFERIESHEKKKPGTVSKVFSTHPTTGSRITRAQALLDNKTFFPPKEEYVVTTSEFGDVKERLSRIYNRRQVTGDPNKPTLRKDPKSTDDKGDQDDRPTLKRRDGGG